MQRKHQLEFRLHLGHPSLTFLWDHRVGGSAILPGAAYFEAAQAAARALTKLPNPATALTDAAISAPLKLPAPADAGSVVLAVEVALASGVIAICSAPVYAKPAAKGGADYSVSHLKGSLVAFSAGAGVKQRHAQDMQPEAHECSAEIARAGCTEPQATTGVYSRLLSAGLQYGPEFRLLRGIQRNSTAAASSWLHSGGRDAAVTGFLLHPALLDNALQLGAVVPEAAGPRPFDGAAFVPSGLAVYTIMSPLHQGSAALVQARRADNQRASGAASATYRDHTVLDGSGAVLAMLNGLEAKQLHGNASRGTRDADAATTQPELLYEVAWLATTTVPGLAAAEAGNASLSLRAGSSTLAAASATLATLQGSLAQEVAFLQLHTAAVQAVDTLVPGSAWSSAAAAAAPAWGMLRSFAQEAPARVHSGQQVDAFNMRQPAGGTAAVILSHKLPAAPSDGYGMTVHGGTGAYATLLPSRRTRPAAGPYHLLPQPRGAFSRLVPQPVTMGTAPAGWVEVQVQAVGINFRCGLTGSCLQHCCCGCPVACPALHCITACTFLCSRDVLNVLGMYPGDPGPPGGDFAGIVARVPSGSAASGLQPGDAVFGLAAGSLGSYVHASVATLAPMPANLDFEEAATMPTVFITVDIALQQMARIAAHDTVLVHAAAGGVGLAAMQLIRAAGATALATAGSPNKRALLRSLGARNAVSSRDTAFVSEVAELGGATIVLNSLTSSGMVAGSVAALGVSGRLVEISKRDIWSMARVAHGEMQLCGDAAFSGLYS